MVVEKVKEFCVVVANPEPKVVVAPEYKRPEEPTLRAPTASDGKLSVPAIVEEALVLVKKPLVKSMTVEVEL